MLKEKYINSVCSEILNWDGKKLSDNGQLQYIKKIVFNHKKRQRKSIDVKNIAEFQPNNIFDKVCKFLQVNPESVPLQYHHHEYVFARKAIVHFIDKLYNRIDKRSKSKRRIITLSEMGILVGRNYSSVISLLKNVENDIEFNKMDKKYKEIENYIKYNNEK